MHRKAGITCKTLGILLLIAAMLLLAYNRWDNRRAGQVAAVIRDALEEAEEEEQTFDEGSSGDGEMDTIEVDGYEYIGTLSIPGFGLELPVMAEWSYPGLKVAPGCYTGSVRTDDLIICGHNYDRHFGNLKNLEAGDAVTFTDVNGNVFDYLVEEVMILQPADVEEMVEQTSNGWDLTLFTCTIGGRARVTVRCIRTE